MLWVPGVLPWAQGQPVPPRSRGALTAPRWRVGFFKESVTFCLNLQVDFANTSAEAVANFVIYRSQNTYKRDLYHYIMVQREKMQPWEGSWLNGKQTSQPSAPTAPPPPPLHALWRCPLAVLHLQQQQIFQLLFHLYSEHGHKETQHHQKVSVCFSPQEDNINLLLLISDSTGFAELPQSLSHNIALCFVQQRVKAVSCTTLGAVFCKNGFSDPAHHERYAGEEEW